MPYINGSGTYHDRRRCRRLHNTGGRIRRIDDAGDRDGCDHCTDGGTDGTEPDIEQQIERGSCPWCDRDGFSSVGRHASASHADEWESYRDR